MDPSGWRTLAPLVLATMASQAMVVVLTPTIVAIASDFDATVPAIGQARSITAVVAVVTSVALSGLARPVSMRATLRVGAVLALVASAGVATARTLPLFFAAHVVVGAAQGLLLSAGFAGVAAFSGSQRRWATGYVSAAQAFAWVVVNPAAAALTGRATWRLAHLIPAAVAMAALLTAPLMRSVGTGTDTPRWAPLRHTSARRWIGAEATGFAAWTAALTFAGAFFIERTGVAVGTAGWILAGGALAYFAASTGSGWLTSRIPGRALVVTCALVMAVLFPVMLSAGLPSAGAAVVFGIAGFVAGVRTPASTALGLEQLPGQPAAMMAARTAAVQTGYLLGAIVGGAVIAAWDYPALGFGLAVIMALSAMLFLRLDGRADSGQST